MAGTSVNTDDSVAALLAPTLAPLDDPDGSKAKLAQIRAQLAAQPAQGVSRPPADPISTSSAPTTPAPPMPAPQAPAAPAVTAPSADPTKTLGQRLQNMGTARQATATSPQDDAANPDPQGSLAPGGTNPGADPKNLQALGQQMGNTPTPQVTGPSGSSAAPQSSGGGLGAKLKHILGRVGDVAVSSFAPGVAQYIPQTTVGKAREAGIARTAAESQAKIADQQSQTAQRKAEGDKAEAQAGANTARAITAQEAAAAGNPALEGAMMRPSDIGKIAVQGLKGATATAVGAGHDKTREEVAQANNDAQADLRAAGVSLKKAQTDAANADPNTMAGRQAIAKLKSANAGHDAAMIRAQAAMGNYRMHSQNLGLDGKVLPGAPEIQNDSGQTTVVGTANAAHAIKAQANVAQFNDVHGALDSLEKSAQALVSKHGKGGLSDPIVAAGLSHPAGTFGQWIQGQVAAGRMSPQQRDYVIANRAAHENIQALRKSAGGTSTDSSVAKLDSMIPGAQTPDIDFLHRQVKQIRATADRLGKGVTHVEGGASVREPSTDSKPKPAAKAGGFNWDDHPEVNQ